MLRMFMFAIGNLRMFATYEVRSVVLLRSWTALFLNYRVRQKERPNLVGS